MSEQIMSDVFYIKTKDKTTFGIYDLTLSDNLVFPLDLQLKHFLDIVDGKSTPSCDIFDGFRAIKTILNPTKYVELR